MCGLAPCRKLQTWINEPLTRTLEGPGLFRRLDSAAHSAVLPLADSGPSALLCAGGVRQVRGPFVPIPNRWQVEVGVLGTGPGTPRYPQTHLPSLTPVRPGYSQSARRRRMEGDGCVRGHPASAAEWACAAPRRCSATPPQ